MQFFIYHLFVVSFKGGNLVKQFLLNVGLKIRYTDLVFFSGFVRQFLNVEFSLSSDKVVKDVANYANLCLSEVFDLDLYQTTGCGRVIFMGSKYFHVFYSKFIANHFVIYIGIHCNVLYVLIYI